MIDIHQKKQLNMQEIADFLGIDVSYVPISKYHSESQGDYRTVEKFAKQIRAVCEMKSINIVDVFSYFDSVKIINIFPSLKNSPL